MEKYATYQVFKHKETGEIKRIPLDNREGLEKIAEDSKWTELPYDPEDE